MNRISQFLIVFLIFPTILLGQIPGLTQFTTDNGLPSNTIYDTVQDDNGFIWKLDQNARNVDGNAFVSEFQTAYTDLSYIDPSLGNSCGL